MAHSEGFEPSTARFVAEYSIQLSYECVVFYCEWEGLRRTILSVALRAIAEAMSKNAPSIFVEPMRLIIPTAQPVNQCCFKETTLINWR